MTERKYLLDVFKENNLELKEDKLNLIVAPCGCGKTTFFFEYLAQQYELKRILYVVDTTMLQESMLNEYKQEIISYNKLNIFRNKISLMSFQKFGMLLKSHENFLDQFDLVVMDEAHNIIKYSRMGSDDVERIADKYVSKDDILQASSHIHGCTYLMLNLPTIVENSKTTFVLMTATPSALYTHEPFKNAINNVLKGIELQGYINRLTLEYKDSFKNIPKLLKYHNQGDKILVYSKLITSCKEITELFKELGYNAACLWSVNSKKLGMDDHQLELRDYIINNNRYPDDLDVLVINGAYETGWNLKDPRVQTVIINSSEIDASIQARGRCRHDINLLIQRSYNAHNSKLEEILKKYEGIKIHSKEQKQSILEELGEYTKKGTLIGWITFKKLVESTGKYYIKNSNSHIEGKKTRYDEIIKRD